MKRTCGTCNRLCEWPCRTRELASAACDYWKLATLERLEDRIIENAFYRRWYVSCMLDCIGKQSDIVIHPDREDGYLGSIGYDLFIALARITDDQRRECAVEALGADA